MLSEKDYDDYSTRYPHPRDETPPVWPKVAIFLLACAFGFYLGYCWR